MKPAGFSPPYVLKEAGGRRIAVIGQAFPYTAVANPRRFIPDWSFGIRIEQLQEAVEQVRRAEKPDLVVLVSHNGYDLDRAVGRAGARHRPDCGRPHP